MIADIDANVKTLSLECEISYKSSREVYDKVANFLEDILPEDVRDHFVERTKERRTPLLDVSFVAKPGEITGIMGNDQTEMKAVIDIISRQRKYGMLSGDVALSSVTGKVTGDWLDHVAYVPPTVLYTKGLTFLETVEYAARLHMVGVSDPEEGREQAIVLANHALESIGAARRLHTRVEGDSDMTRRGDLGGDLRRLDIAMELVRRPSVIVVDGAGDQLEAAQAAELFTDLKALAKKGHTIICSLSRPSQAVFEQLDSVVLLMQGRSVFHGPRVSMTTFLAEQLHYSLEDQANVNTVDGLEETGVVDFVLGILGMTERPVGAKAPLRAEDIQLAFQQSDYYSAMGLTVNEREGSMGSMMDDRLSQGSGDLNSGLVRSNRLFAYSPPSSTPTLFRDASDYWWGVGGISQAFMKKADSESAFLTNTQKMVLRGKLILLRAFQEKFRDFESLKRQFGSCILVSTVIGYFLWSQGDDFGDYCLNMTLTPYNQVANLIASFFFIMTFSFVGQVLNVQAMVAKINIFKRQRRDIPPLLFGVTTLLVELSTAIPSNMFFTLIYYKMTLVKKDDDGYMYLMTMGALMVILGQLMNLAAASIFLREIPCRDIFLTLTFLMLFMSGYPFQLPTMRDYVAEMTQICPMRWAFEGLMIWKWGSDCGDGQTMLSQYGFGSSAGRKEYILGYMVYFNIIPLVAFLLSLFPAPGRLMVKKRSDSRPTSAASSGNNRPSSTNMDDNRNKPILPVIMSRTGSMTSEVSLCITMSTTGQEIQTQGTNVTFKGLSYAVPDETCPLGKRTIIHNAEGSFGWGRLSAIMGSSGSGKSSLLYALAGAITKNIAGEIMYNNKPINHKTPLWHRVALIEASDNFLRDLTVEQTIWYAMQLRRVTTMGDSTAEENVKRVMSAFELDSKKLRDTKVKRLTAGERRRLNIASAIVHGPGLIMIDEPFTGIDAMSVGIIMTALRNLVNQDKTVVVSVHEPSPALFELFDSLMLLSMGRIIYHGRSAHALQHFQGIQFLQDEKVSKDGTTEYLLKMSAARCKCVDGTFASSLMLEEYMRNAVVVRRRSLASAKKGAAMTTSGGMHKPMISPVPFRESEHSIDSLNISGSQMSKQPKEGGGGSKRHHSESEEEDDLVYKEDLNTFLFKLKILLMRSASATFYRSKLVVGSTVAHIILALFMAWILGDTEGNTYNTTSFMTIGVLLLILLNIQQVFWLRSVYDVYEGDVRDGLYSPLAYWLVGSLPLYLVRTTNALIFGLITYGTLGFKKEYLGYFLLQVIIAVLAGATLTELITYSTGSIRSVYLALPAVSTVFFFFSGLPVKPDTLPHWIRPWGPSISVIRWAAQSLCINEFSDKTGSMADVVTPLFTISPYERYLNIFGWGGLSKWNCMGFVVLFMVIFRSCALLILHGKPFFANELRHIKHNYREGARVTATGDGRVLRVTRNTVVDKFDNSASATNPMVV